MNELIKTSIEEKIRNYEKNITVLCDMLTFYKSLDEEKVSLESYTLLDKVIKDLEDNEVMVPFKANSIEEILANYQEESSDLKQLCKSYGINIQIKEDFRLNLIKKYFIESLESKKRYNFLEKVYKTSKNFINEFLTSNIPLSKKVNFLYDTILLISKDGYGPSMLENLFDSNFNVGKLNRTSSEIKEREIKILIESFFSYLNKNVMKKSELFLQLLKNQLWANEWVFYLQKNNMVDFTNLACQIKLFDQKVDCSVCSYLNLEDTTFLNFYNIKDYYSKVPKEIRDNDDLYILEKIDISDLATFIASKNFEIAENKIFKIAERVLTYQKELKECDWILIENIKQAIIKKASNSREYHQMNSYAKVFVQRSDYEFYVQEEKEKNQQLLLARTHLMLLFHNLNESLQEQIPSRVRIKNILFKK